MLSLSLQKVRTSPVMNVLLFCETPQRGPHKLMCTHTAHSAHALLSSIYQHTFSLSFSSATCRHRSSALPKVRCERRLAAELQRVLLFSLWHMVKRQARLHGLREAQKAHDVRRQLFPGGRAPWREACGALLLPRLRAQTAEMVMDLTAGE